MSTYPATWMLCGGWAIDAWLGRETREHLDIDIMVFAQDHRAIFDQLPSWNLVVHDALNLEAARAGSNEFWDGREPNLPAHLHARPPGEDNREAVLRWVTAPFQAAQDGQDYDVVFNERRDGRWILGEEPALSLPIEATFAVSASGLPTALPEVLLFYKATAYFDPAKPSSLRPHDHADFEALSPMLAPRAAVWLREAIAARFPEHPWLERLAS